jgi:hypothetical protein
MYAQNHISGIAYAISITCTIVGAMLALALSFPLKRVFIGDRE